MYFVNEEHENNFNQLLRQYPVGEDDPQYQAGFYVVAHPVIFNHCDGNPVSDGHGPFDWYFEELENPPSHTSGLAGFPSSILLLVKAGLNLYNNHKHEDSYADFSPYSALGTWGDDLFRVFVEACQIRRNRKIIAV